MNTPTNAYFALLGDKWCKNTLLLPFFTHGILYICLHPKKSYDEADMEDVSKSIVIDFLNMAKARHPDVGIIHQNIAALTRLQTALKTFEETHHEPFHLNFILRNCQKEIQAQMDYLEMVNANFSAEDIVTVIESYMSS